MAARAHKSTDCFRNPMEAFAPILALGSLLHLISTLMDRPPEDCKIESFLAREVVVDRGFYKPSGLRDITDRYPVKSSRSE
jgi:hypothetical protein